MSPRRRCISSERGQTSAEYLGVIVLVTAIIAALALSPIGAAIADGIDRAICEITGGDCDGEVAAEEEPCVVATQTTTTGVNGKVFVVTFGESGTLIREDRSDGSTRFTLIDNSELGAEIAAGIKAHAGGVGIDAVASAAAEGRLEGAQIFEFGPDEQEEADEFADNSDGLAGFEGIARDALEGNGIFSSPVSGILGENPVGDWVGDQIGLDDEDDLPDPDATYTSAAGALEAQASASVGAGPLASAELSAAVDAAGGGRYFTSGENEGKAQIFVELSAEAAGSLMAGTLGPGVEGSDQVVGTLTFGANGEPESLELAASADYTGDLNLATELEGADLGDLASRIESASLGASGGEGGRIEFTAELDLTDPANRDAALSVLNPTTGAAGVPGLIERFADDGTLTLQTSSLSTSEVEGELEVSLGVGGGGGFGTSEETTETQTVLVKEPDASGFVEREC